MIQKSAFAAAAAAVLLLTACQTPANFQPANGENGTGYTDQQLAANRWRVTFTGNSSTKREMVENYLLLRAAQVAEQAGYDWFIFDTRDTATETTYHSFDSWPVWPRVGRYRPFGLLGPRNNVTVRPSTAYQAYAEIILLTGEQAKAEPRALGVKDVIAHIGAPAAPPK